MSTIASRVVQRLVLSGTSTKTAAQSETKVEEADFVKILPPGHAFKPQDQVVDYSYDHIVAALAKSDMLRLDRGQRVQAIVPGAKGVKLLLVQD